MPTYEYACSACKNEWELEQSIKDNAITECPACHHQTAKRQISRSGGFILKGGGWYSDLYSSPSNAKPEGTKAEAPKADAPKADAAKSDSSSTGSGASSSSDSSGGSSTPKSSAPAA